MEFSEWLQNEMTVRGWTQADLARYSNTTGATISRLMSGSRNIGPDLAQAIAGAFKLPPEVVFRAAGLLPDLPNPRNAAEEILGFKIAELTDEEIDDLLAYIEFIQAKRDRNPTIKKHREGEAPPEVVKK